MDRKVLAAGLSIASNSVLVAAKLIIGVMSGSVSIISEAAHSGLDLFASVIAFLSVRVSGRPADKEHPFGHGKVENLSGAFEAVLILLAAIFIIHESVDKLRHPRPVETVELGLVVMGVSIVANTLISRYLFRVAREADSIALEADGHHLSTDVWTSLGVFAGLGLIRLTGWHVVDPIVAIGVALMIMRVAFSLTWKAAGPLMDQALPEGELGELRELVMSNPKIVGYHKLRTRKSGPFREIDYHLIVPGNITIEEAHEIAERIEDEMRERYPGTHVVTHIEPDTADTVDEPGTHVKPSNDKS
ncbi:MAG: cation diffusion facilitator family transporter [Armatimonadota bacterium]